MKSPITLLRRVLFGASCLLPLGLHAQEFSCSNPDVHRAATPSAPHSAAVAVVPPYPCEPYYIKVNIHYMLHPNPDSVNNFAEANDGGSTAAWKWDRAGNHLQSNPVPWGPLPRVFPRSDYNGYSFAKSVINEANAQNATNAPMQLPVGNTTPVVAKNISYVLGGVYFHRDATKWQYDPWNHYADPAGVLSPAQFNTYGTDKGTEINIFLMGQNTYHQDPNVPRWIYWSGGAANFGYSANNNWMKIGNVWRNHLISRVNDPNSNDNNSAGFLAHTINHELGHLLGLYHPADYQQCSDTPPTGPGYTLADGNNLMDYNMQNVLTPCQISTMHQTMRNYYSAYTYCNTGCPPIHAFFTIPTCVALGTVKGVVTPNPALVLDGRGSWMPGSSQAYQITITEVDNYGVQIPGTTSSTYNYTGEADRVNLNSLYAWQLNKRYAIKLVVTTNCSSNTATQYVQTSNIGCMSSQPGGMRAADVTLATMVDLFPNPTATGEFSVTTAGSVPARIVVRDLRGKTVEMQVQTRKETTATTGTTVTYRLSTGKPGLYMVEITEANGQRTVRQLSVAP